MDHPNPYSPYASGGGPQESKLVEQKSTEQAAMDIDQSVSSYLAQASSLEQIDQQVRIIEGLKELFNLPKDTPVMSVLSTVSNQIDSLRPSKSAFQFFKARKQYLDFKQLFDFNPVAMAVCALSGSFISCNEKWASLTGLQQETISKYTIVSISHPHGVVQLYEALQMFAEGKRTSWSAIQHCIHPLGFQFSAHIEITPLEMFEGDAIFSSSSSSTAEEQLPSSGITSTTPVTFATTTSPEDPTPIPIGIPIHSRSQTVSQDSSDSSRRTSIDMGGIVTANAPAGASAPDVEAPKQTRTVLLCTVISVAGY